MNEALPELPEPALLKDAGWEMDVATVKVRCNEWEPGAYRVPRRSYFSQDQMRAYALAAIQQERAGLLATVENVMAGCGILKPDRDYCLERIAAIRATPPPR